MKRAAPLTALLLCMVAQGCEGPIEDHAPASARKAAADDEAEPIPQLFDGAAAFGITSRTVVHDRETHKTSSYSVTATGLAGMLQQGSDVAIAVKLCQLELPRLGSYQPAIEQSLVDRLPSVRFRGRLERGPDDGLSFASEQIVFTLGLDPDHPSDAEMPEQAGDAGELDQDGDGKPGATLGVSWVDVYAALRARLALSAEIAPVDGEASEAPQISGSFTFAKEWTIFGDSTIWVDVGAILEHEQSVQQLRSQTNTFTLRPQPGLQRCPTVDEALGGL